MIEGDTISSIWQPRANEIRVSVWGFSRTRQSSYAIPHPEHGGQMVECEARLG